MVQSSTENSHGASYISKNSSGEDYLSSHDISNVSLWSFGSYLDPDGTIALHLILRGIVMPIVAAFGLVANVLNAAVLTPLARRKSSATYSILLAMTVADFFIAAWSLLGGALLYMRTDPVLTPVDLERLSNAGRTVFRALDPATNVFAFISNWCTAAIAAVRFAAVYYPLKSQQWCTQRSAVVAIAAISAVAVLFTVPPRVLDESESVSRTNGSTKQHREYHVAYAIVIDVLPWTLCVALVSLLLASLRQRSSSSNVPSQRRNQGFDKCRRLTVTLISTAAWFVVTTAPSTVSVVISFWYENSKGQSASLSRLSDVGQLLALINFAGNVFFYSLINSSHRKQLKKLLCKVSARRRTTIRLAYSSSRRSRSANAAIITRSSN